MAGVLLVDDDIELCRLLKSYLETDTLRVDCVYDGNDALDRLLGPEAVSYDLLLLDVMLPGTNGFDVLKAIRERGLQIPVLMLTARNESVDRIAGLEGGADDYVCKPCEPRELAARIAGILRRTRGNNEGAEPGGTLRVGDIELDRIMQIARISKHDVILTDVEYRLLEALLQNAGDTVSLESLFRDVLEREYTYEDRSLHTHASRLRRKLGNHSNGTARIKTIRGKGFAYINPPTCESETRQS